jgi:hypothetical protein
VPVNMDEVDALQPFQPFVLPDLPSRSVAPIPQVGAPSSPFNAPELDTRPSDPIQPAPGPDDDMQILNP